METFIFTFSFMSVEYNSLVIFSHSFYMCVNPFDWFLCCSDKKLSTSLSQDGRRFYIGDCALFQAGNSPPFIGIIRWFSPDSLNILKLGVSRLYRPSEVKLSKGILLEAAPNEVFYSFHKDEISAELLLHPCKVAFLRKGVELPQWISSFVCRRVYDSANKCLWWLTDQAYIDVSYNKNSNHL